MLLAEWHDVELDGPAHQVVHQLVRSNPRPRRQCLLQLLHAKVGHADVLDLALRLQRGQLFEDGGEIRNWAAAAAGFLVDGPVDLVEVDRVLLQAPEAGLELAADVVAVLGLDLGGDHRLSGEGGRGGREGSGQRLLAAAGLVDLGGVEEGVAVLQGGQADIIDVILLPLPPVLTLLESMRDKSNNSESRQKI